MSGFGKSKDFHETGPLLETFVVVVDRKNSLVALPLISRCAFPRRDGE